MKIQSTMPIKFISSKGSVETRTMCSKSDEKEIMTGSETDATIEELFESILQECQEGLEKSTRQSKFVSDSFDLLYYELRKIV